MRQRWVIIPCLVYSLFLGATNSGQGNEAERTKTAPSSKAAAARDPKTPAVEKTSAATESKLGRIREGSRLVDQSGEFQKSGDQINFFSKEGHGALRVLENLALERVARVLDDNPTMRLWSVTGTITEYRGENYLLVTRAVLKAQQPKSSPAVEHRKAESGDKKVE